MPWRTGAQCWRGHRTDLRAISIAEDPKSGPGWVSVVTLDQFG